MSDAGGPSSRRASRATSRPETPPSTPPLSVAGNPSIQLHQGISESSFVRRLPQPKPSVDLRLVDYVSPVDGNLVCLICHCPFYEPRQVPCDHVFCKECLSMAFRSQSAAQKNCPTCRTPVAADAPLKDVPRLVTRMLDELVIKCPNSHLGCTWSDKRSDVQDHIELYCDFISVDCPDKNCKQEVLHRDLHKGCLHGTVSCPYCHISMMEKDFDNHGNDHCAASMIECEKCQMELQRGKLPAHLDEDCPKTILNCPGEPVGCSFTAERASLPDHVKDCAMAKMAPYLAAQNHKLETCMAEQRLQARKLTILEGSFQTIQEMVDASALAPPPPMNTQLEDMFSGFGEAQEAIAPPFESSTDHLLSLQETLREEIHRTATALAEVDGRITMEVLNNQAQTRDEILQIRMAIFNLRNQLQWLMSARQQAPNRLGNTINSINTNPNNSGVAGSSTGIGLQPIRRLSDPNRQDPKL